MTPMTSPRAAWRRAFTLIELLVAVVLLAAAMTVTVRSLAWIAAERRASERRQLAIQEVANVMERVAGGSFENVTPEAARAASLSTEARDVLPNAELTVTVDDKAAGEGSKRIAVRLRWRNRAGQWDAPVRLTSWVSRRGGAR